MSETATTTLAASTTTSVAKVKHVASRYLLGAATAPGHSSKKAALVRGHALPTSVSSSVSKVSSVSNNVSHSNSRSRAAALLRSDENAPPSSVAHAQKKTRSTAATVSVALKTSPQTTKKSPRPMSQNLLQKQQNTLPLLQQTQKAISQQQQKNIKAHPQNAAAVQTPLPTQPQPQKPSTVNPEPQQRDKTPNLISQKPDSFAPSDVHSLLASKFDFLLDESPSVDSKESEVMLAHAKLIQWQFLKAKAKSCFMKRKAEAESQIYSGWQCVRNLKSQIHNLKSEIAARTRLKSELNLLQYQETSLRKALRAIQAFRSDYIALAKGLETSIVRMNLINVKLSSPIELRDCLKQTSSRLKAIFENKPIFPKVEVLANQVSVLKKAITTDTSLLKDCVQLAEDVSILEVSELSYKIEKDQLRLR